MIKLFGTKSCYHDIQVVEEFPIRQLKFGTGVCQQQSAIDLTDPDRHIFDYTLLAMNNLLFVPEPSDILIIGLGGGVIPRQMNHYVSNAKIDVIEIDPEVVKVAEEYFFFKKNSMIKVYVGDAWEVASRMNKKYDVVVMDAFNKNYIPFHLMSQEFLKVIFSIMKDKSVMSVNTCNALPQFFSQLNTIISVFGENIYRSDGKRNVASTMIFAPKGDIKPMPSDNFFCHLFTIKPESIDALDEIKKSEIFSMNLYNGGKGKGASQC